MTLALALLAGRYCSNPSRGVTTRVARECFHSGDYTPATMRSAQIFGRILDTVLITRRLHLLLEGLNLRLGTFCFAGGRCSTTPLVARIFRVGDDIVSLVANIFHGLNPVVFPTCNIQYWVGRQGNIGRRAGDFPSRRAELRRTLLLPPFRCCCIQQACLRRRNYSHCLPHRTAVSLAPLLRRCILPTSGFRRYHRP